MRALDVVVPLLLVASAAALVVSAARGRLTTCWEVSRPYLWLMIVVWLVLAGDAAFGENRPVFERSWKGAVAVLFAVGFGIDRWRRHRRRRADRPDRPAGPDHPAGPEQPDRADRPDRHPEQVDG